MIFCVDRVVVDYGVFLCWVFMKGNVCCLKLYFVWEYE